MNAESNGERTDEERDANERMRELGRRSGEARRRKREQREQAGELTDREQAKVALRRALDGGNMAAMVAAAKALIEFDHSPHTGGVTVDDARAQLDARLDKIEDHRRRNGQVCPTCDRPLPRDEAAGREGVPGLVGGGV